VILDGKIIPCDRCKEPAISVKGEVIDLWYSARRTPTATSRPCSPGRVPAEDLARGARLGARPHRRPPARSPGSLPRRRNWPAHFGRPGYDGAGIGIGIYMPAKQPTDGRELDINTRTRNAQRSLRCLGERGFALLNQRWRTLQHITASPSKIGDIARAALVLTHFEHGYIS
jgi:hypothetical protein